MSYRFQGQRLNEEVILFTRQHPFVLLRPFLIAAVILLLPLLVYAFSALNSAVGIIILACIALAAAKGYLAWFSWNNSILLVTNERVVQLEQKGVMNREFSESSLQAIQQVSHEVKGLLCTLFGYGTVTVYTGNSLAPFAIKNIPDPYDIQQEIQRAASGEGFEEEEESA